MRESKTCPNQGWKQLPTEELDQILQAELRKEHPDQEVVLPILHELEDRERDIPVENTPEVLAIANKLRKHETSSKQSIQKRRWIAGIAAAAAVVFLVIVTLSPTAKAESFLDALFRWTSSIFEFIDPDKNQSYPNIDNAFATDHPGLQELYDKVTALGVTQAVVPMWLPDGFVLSELQERPVTGGRKVHGEFTNGSNEVLVTYRVSMDISPKVEKKENNFEILDFGGIDHFVVENNDSLSVTWTVDGVECIINTDLSKEDLYTIIKSIYRSELS